MPSYDESDMTFGSLAPGEVETAAHLGSRILVVSARSEVAFLVSAFLDMAGYRNCNSVPDAEQALRRHAEAPYDLFIVDVNGKRPWELATALRSPSGFAPVVALVGECGPECARALHEAGVRDYLTTPVEGLALRFRVRNVLEIAHMEARLLAV